MADRGRFGMGQATDEEQIEVRRAAGELRKIVEEIGRVVKGKRDVTEKVLAAILAGGHVLLEDIPGVGKTTLAMSMGRTMELAYRRMQFTPDVLPSDILGFMMFDAQKKEFVFREGAVFCNLFLADEINRTSSKTQSALLEVMEEGQVTMEGVTHKLPTPFTVIATENPVGSSGTQRLPESQLDRFMVRLTLGYPDHKSAVEILKGSAERMVELICPVITTERVMALREVANKIYVNDSVFEYIVNLTEETRRDAGIELGVSPRGSIALLKMAKAMALMRGGAYVVPDDALSVLEDVWGHRILLSGKARAEGLREGDVLRKIAERIPAVR